jgi:toxin-antitoxin system PIN domain toxin
MGRGVAGRASDRFDNSASHQSAIAMRAVAMASVVDGPAGDGFALCPHTWNGFLRLVTHPTIFATPSPMAVALTAVERWRNRPRSTVLSDTPATWRTFTTLCHDHQAQANAVDDLHLAALAIAHRLALVSSDQGFGRISGLA